MAGSFGSLSSGAGVSSASSDEGVDLLDLERKGLPSTASSTYAAPSPASSASSSGSDLPPKGFLKLNAAAATPRLESIAPRIRRAIESFRDEDADDAAAGTRAAAGRRPPATTRAGVIVRVVTDDALTIAIAGAIADAGKARIRLPTAREDSRCWTDPVGSRFDQSKKWE